VQLIGAIWIDFNAGTKKIKGTWKKQCFSKNDLHIHNAKETGRGTKVQDEAKSGETRSWLK